MGTMGFWAPKAEQRHSRCRAGGGLRAVRTQPREPGTFGLGGNALKQDVRELSGRHLWAESRLRRDLVGGEARAALPQGREHPQGGVTLSGDLLGASACLCDRGVPFVFLFSV